MTTAAGEEGIGPRLRWLRCMGPHGMHRMAYAEWGDPANPRVLMCVHGLTRNGRDFDFLASALAPEYRVVCPDVAGRGRSGRLAVAADYALPVYAADMVTLLARLDVERVDWLGTSMGGVIGMVLASLPDSPVDRLILNDVGTVVTAASLRRIGQFLGASPKFASVEEAERFLRFVSAPFGPLTDAQWRHLTVHSVRPAEGGGFEMTYDPAIAESFRQAAAEGDRDIELWPLYEAIRCPTLVIRGAVSDLLTHETAVEMTQRGPRARLVEVAGVGHAPMLMDEAQVDIVRRFLAEPGAAT